MTIVQLIEKIKLHSWWWLVYFFLRLEFLVI